jgi:NMD protein affecting ribosome stability and mRNA decay
MKRKKKGIDFKQERTRIYDDQNPDVYREKKKYKEPTVCSGCGAVFRNGRWSWNTSVEDAHTAVCPACRRISDKYPAGILEISGSFSEDHKDEILKLIRNKAKAEKNEHPLERIMDIDHQDGKKVISTTGFHLARRLGDALKDAYQGELDISYDAENFIRVYWNR